MQLSVFATVYSALAQSVEHAAVNRSVVGSSPTSGAIPVIMATRIHLFPFRTQKLSSSTAKVLDHPRSGRIASCRISIKNDRFQAENGHFSCVFKIFCSARFIFLSQGFCFEKGWFLVQYDENQRVKDGFKFYVPPLVNKAKGTIK